jgi:hypothetical protein
MRSTGGTFFSFSSPVEDIGLNTTDRNNKINETVIKYVSMKSP